MKVALISDLHFGIKKSDLRFQKSQLSFFEKQLVEESIEIEKFELDKEQIKNGDEEEKTGVKALIDEIIGVANERNKDNKWSI